MNTADAHWSTNPALEDTITAGVERLSEIQASLEPAVEPTTIRLAAAPVYRSEHYGVIYESITQHDVTGPGVHNRHHPHRVDVWENRLDRRDREHGGTGQIVDPHGNVTTDRFSFLLSPQAVMITAHRRDDVAPQGETLRIGSLVRLPGFGVFRIAARPLHNPHLERVSD